LLGYGAGEPPAWIVDAAGAELWAYFTVLSLNAGIPNVVTDCKGILDSLQKEPGHTTGPKKALARTWQFIRHVLDDDFAAARDKLCWMPSHQSASNLAGSIASNGEPVTTLMWRANRLADALAKGIASRHRLPNWALSLVKSAGTLVKHQAARLGTATYLANNYEEQVTLEGGAVVKRFRRDSTAKRPHFKKVGMPVAVATTAASSSTATRATGARVGTRFAAAAAPSAPLNRRRNKRAASVTAHELRRLVDEEPALARCLRAKWLQPSTGPTAAERIARVREKVLARC